MSQGDAVCSSSQEQPLSLPDAFSRPSHTLREVFLSHGPDHLSEGGGCCSLPPAVTGRESLCQGPPLLSSFERWRAGRALCSRRSWQTAVEQPAPTPKEPCQPSGESAVMLLLQAGQGLSAGGGMWLLAGRSPLHKGLLLTPLPGDFQSPNSFKQAKQPLCCCCLEITHYGPPPPTPSSVASEMLGRCFLLKAGITCWSRLELTGSEAVYL